MKFSSLISLCIIYFECKYAIILIILKVTLAAFSSEKKGFLSLYSSKLFVDKFSTTTYIYSEFSNSS